MKYIILIGILAGILVSGCVEVTERVHHRGEPCDVDYKSMMDCNITYGEPKPECARLWDKEMIRVQIKGYCMDGYRTGGIY